MNDTKETSYLAPERLYTLRGFWTASGISPTRVREAKRCGNHLNCLEVGKRKFVRGSDGIAFIERLATNCTAEKAMNCNGLAG